MTALSYKEKVARSFSRAASSYDTFATLQRDVATKTAAMIERTPARVLDIGCGTGNVTKELLRLYPKAKVFAVDLSHAMVEATNKNTDRCKGVLTADLEALPFRDSTFDTLISSLTYQWTEDLLLATAEAYRVLTPGGTFVFSTLGEDTFKELKKVRTELFSATGRNGLAPSIKFPTSDILSKAIKNAGFEIKTMRTEEVRREYEDLFTLLRTLKGIGALNPSEAKEKTLAQGTILRELSLKYSTNFSIRNKKSIYATYDILYFTLTKPY